MHRKHDDRDRLLQFGARLVWALKGQPDLKLGELLVPRFPWLKHLPEKDREQCVQDFLDAAFRSYLLSNAEPLELELASWRSTAAAMRDGLVPSNDWLPKPIPVRRPRVKP